MKDLFISSTDADVAFAEAAEHLDRAADGLRKAAREDHLPRALLRRAGFHRLRAVLASATGSASNAHGAADADLAEALDIASRGEMRLHLADTLLEWTRLYLDRGDIAAAREHHVEAARLVTETGYHRRDREVAYLARRLAQQR